MSVPPHAPSEAGQLNQLKPITSSPIPMVSSVVAAGFPSPAESWVEKSLDLNDLCIINPDSSYFVRVKGDSMVDAGIQENDYLIVDRAYPFFHNAIVIARVGTELTVKRLETKPVMRLVPANPNYPPIEPDGADIELIGVATFAIRRLLP